MFKKTLVSLFVAIIAITSLGFSASAVHAESGSDSKGEARMEFNAGGSGTSFGARLKSFLGIHDMRKENRLSGLRGVVTAVTGTTLTLDVKIASTTPVTSYTVDAANALFVKNNATSTTLAVAVGDQVVAQGTLVGTTMTAKIVVDGVPPMGTMKKGDGKEAKKEMSKGMLRRAFEVRGVVTAVNGFSITVDGRTATSTATTTYAVDATNAKIVKDNATTTVASVLVGDRVLVNGTLTGTSVSATLIIDGKLPPLRDLKDVIGDEDGNNQLARPEAKFFSKIGSFFKAFFHFGGNK